MMENTSAPAFSLDVLLPADIAKRAEAVGARSGVGLVGLVYWVIYPRGEEPKTGDQRPKNKDEVRTRNFSGPRSPVFDLCLINRS